MSRGQDNNNNVLVIPGQGEGQPGRQFEMPEISQSTVTTGSRVLFDYLEPPTQAPTPMPTQMKVYRRYMTDAHKLGLLLNNAMVADVYANNPYGAALKGGLMLTPQAVTMALDAAYPEKPKSTPSPPIILTTTDEGVSQQNTKEYNDYYVHKLFDPLHYVVV